MSDEPNLPSTQTPGTKIDWDNPRDEVYFTEGIRAPDDPTLKLYLLSEEEIEYFRALIALYPRGTTAYKRWGRIQENLVGKGILLDSSRPVIYKKTSEQLTQNEINFIRACYAAFSRDYKTVNKFTNRSDPMGVIDVITSLKDKGILL